MKPKVLILDAETRRDLNGILARIINRRAAGRDDNDTIISDAIDDIFRLGAVDAAQAASNCGDGFLPVEEWPKEIDERVLLYVVHQNAQYEQDEAKRKAEWEGWFTGYWTDFNKGGWVWHGMFGKVTHIAALLPAPASPLPSTDRGSEA